MNVQFSEIVCRRGKIGVATLANPKALNSLTLDMVRSLAPQLLKWENDADIAVVVLHSDLERAFCAGGDVKTVAQGLLAGTDNGYAEEFFRWEYKTDFLIQTYSKPIVTWGDGIVMGGGIGLHNGASHRVVTERTTLAMPEITIGFFPDVGGGYFLNRLPEGVGLFLGWTGARLSSADAMHLEMADFYIPSALKASFFERLLSQEWSRMTDNNNALLAGLLFELAIDPPESHLARFEDEIRSRLSDRDALESHESLLSWEPTDTWLQSCLSTWRKGSPFSAWLVFEQLKRSREMPLLDIFVNEWTMAAHLCRGHDFPEGVRALLIDKDGTPDWRPSRFEDVNPADVAACFASLPGTAAMRAFLEDREADL